MIPYGRQHIDSDDIASVLEVLQSDFLTQGPAVPKFEKVVASKTGVKHALATNSATSALHIACMALGLGSGDLLWTSPITFVASANCALYCGATVDFVDIDPTTFNICTAELEKKLILAKHCGNLPKIIVVVHMAGQSCDMQGIGALSKEYGFRVIEDASHAIGGKYEGQYIGNCKYSDITVFSFHPVKIITTAEGGIATTNDDDLAQSLSLLRSHGITRSQKIMSYKSSEPWYYEQVELGYNYRMTDIQAALGISQMNRLDDFVARRHEIAKRYDILLKDAQVIIPQQTRGSYSSFHLYIIRVIPDVKIITRKAIFEKLIEKGIGVNVHYIPVHTQPFYKKIGFKYGDFPKAEAYYEQAISLPIHFSLTDDDQDLVVSSLIDAINYKKV
jgi:UDP-4-amino-4,6-dideoxy-N-acetyl-beta-L-altrosamine transaminase